MIVIVGATGCVGSRLARRLVARGERVRVLVRDGSKAPAGTIPVRGDLLEPGSLDALFAGDGEESARVVYYLAHGMGRQPRGSGDLEKDERAAARSTLERARAAGVERVVFVSGLGAAADAPSLHLRGRFAVEEEVRASGIPWTILRAGALLGPGSVGFETALRVFRRSRFIPLPPWRSVRMQPYALSDALAALERAGREDAFAGRTIELGTSDVPTYADLFRGIARASRLRRIFVPIPFATLELPSTAAFALIARVPWRMAAALVETLVRVEALVQDGGAAMRELGLPVRTLDETLSIALRDTVADRELELVPA